MEGGILKFHSRKFNLNPTKKLSGVVIFSQLNSECTSTGRFSSFEFEIDKENNV